MAYRKHPSYSRKASDEEYLSTPTDSKGKRPSSSSYIDKHHSSSSSSLHPSHPSSSHRSSSSSSSLHPSHPSSSYRSSSPHDSKKYLSPQPYNDDSYLSPSSSLQPRRPSSASRPTSSSYVPPLPYNDQKYPPSSSSSYSSYSSPSKPSSSSHPSHSSPSYPQPSSHSGDNYQPPVSSHGKHYAPSGITRPAYRGSNGVKIDKFLATKDPQYIKTERLGDFHTSRQDTAYFTFDKEYAKELRPQGGKILRMDIPREMLRDAHKFDDVPSEDWYHLVEKCRRNEKAEGRMKRVQKMDIIEGPVAHTSTESIVHSRPPTPKGKFKPRMREDEYVQQVAFKGDALRRLGTLHGRLSPP
ncbi:hypothetical protein GGS20DRAFT_124950 [Poronia punctata]|nr:hypothetical protein GGS20DRAFT_124950 [Poronia punctata]